MCGDLLGGSKKSQQNIAIWQAQKAEEAAAENERQRLAAQQQMADLLRQQQEREATILAEQQKAAQSASAEAKAAEAQRQKLITDNRGAIDSAFAGFNDDYYTQAADRYGAAYLPKLEEQRAQALDQLKSALAARGTLQSTAGINSINDLEKKAAEERAGVASRGLDFANSLRASVGTKKNALYDTAGTAADPAGFAARATGEATSLVNLGGVVPYDSVLAYGSQSQPSGVAAPQNSSVFASILAPLTGAATTALSAPRGAGRITVGAQSNPITGSGTSSVRS